MIKKISFILLTICALLANAGPMAGANPPDFNDGAEMKTLEWGFRFATAIPAKPHIVDRSNSQYSVLNLYLEKQMPEKAATLADRIDDWHRCLFYADLAYYFAERDSIEKARHYLDQAGDCWKGLEGFNAGWQKDRVSVQMAKSRVLARLEGGTEAFDEKLPAESAASNTAFRLSRLDGNIDEFGNRIDQLAAMETSEYMEVKRDVAVAYISILKQLGKNATEAQCTSLQTHIYSIAGKLPRLLEHEILSRLSQTAFDTEHREMGKAVFAHALEQLRAQKRNPRYDVSSLSELARIWCHAGEEPSRSASLLNEADDLLKTSGLGDSDRIPALVSLALGYGICGNENGAWDNFHNALQTAASLVNARPRAMAITRICNGIAQWGAPLPDEMEKELTRLYGALGDPW